MSEAYVSFFEGGFLKFKIFPISNFSQIRSDGGSSNFQFFPNSKKSKTSRKLWTFSTFCDIFSVGLFPKASTTTTTSSRWNYFSVYSTRYIFICKKKMTKKNKKNTILTKFDLCLAQPQLVSKFHDTFCAVQNWGNCPNISFHLLGSTINLSYIIIGSLCKVKFRWICRKLNIEAFDEDGLFWNNEIGTTFSFW